MLISFRWAMISAYNAIIPSDIAQALDVDSYAEDITEDVLGASFDLADTLAYLVSSTCLSFYSQLIKYNIIASFIPMLNVMSNARYIPKLRDAI